MDKNDEQYWYLHDLLKDSRLEEYGAVKKLWEESETKDGFETTLLETQDPILLGSKAYARVFSSKDSTVREKYAKQMFERVINSSALNPQSALSVFSGATYSTVLLIDNGDVEIATDEEATNFESHYGVVVFDYTKVKPDQFACRYPFNRFMKTNGGQYYIHTKKGIKPKIAFRSWADNTLDITNIVLSDAAHYMICAISGYVFIAKIDED